MVTGVRPRQQLFPREAPLLRTDLDLNRRLGGARSNRQEQQKAQDQSA